MSKVRKKDLKLGLGCIDASRSLSSFNGVSLLLSLFLRLLFSLQFYPRLLLPLLLLLLQFLSRPPKLKIHSSQTFLNQKAKEFYLSKKKKKEGKGVLILRFLLGFDSEIYNSNSCTVAFIGSEAQCETFIACLVSRMIWAFPLGTGLCRTLHCSLRGPTFLTLRPK